MLLAADVGGTKTNLAIFSPQEGPRAPLEEATLSSSRYTSLEELVEDFLSRVQIEVDRASFGVAGPVVGRQVEVTNLPWDIDADRLEEALGLSSVHLINDLAAIAQAVPMLEGEDLETLSEGQVVPDGAIAVIAPGTGLGEAFLTWDGSSYRAHPSEGGHTDFGPLDAQQAELLRYLQGRFDHVSYERIASGLGMPNIYAFLRDSSYAEEPAWLAEKLEQVDDPTPVIFDAALDEKRPCALCVAALDLFVSVLGAEAGNLALKVLATSGVYVGGGIPVHILSALKDGRFLRAFRSKGRFTDLMSRIPVHVILNPKAALIGAAVAGLQR